MDPTSDYAAIFAGDVSITPLHLDPTRRTVQDVVMAEKLCAVRK